MTVPNGRSAVPEELLHHIATEMADRFPGVFARETVDRYVFESYAALARTAKVHTYLPLLTERFVHERLTALAQSKGAIVTDVPEVLFVCVHNAGRSQMAAALLAHHAQGRVHVRSAGSTPVDQIHPTTVQAMRELGLDLSTEFPKPLTADVVQAADVVVTMGCGDTCPIYPGKRYFDWDLKDPAGKDLDTVREIRDEIVSRVWALIQELQPQESGLSSYADGEMPQRWRHP